MVLDPDLVLVLGDDQILINGGLANTYWVLFCISGYSG